ncbi:MAG TPA: efflux RND transporter periplasmic adaptor subunit [Thermoanaerobaculia bacterium]|nr:efflux RND transporter periplasmic adaptor subunit [Thermoanaerobaculia bacterium]
MLDFAAVKRLGCGALVVAILAVAGFLFVRSRGEKPVVVDVEPVVRRPDFQSFVTASGEIVASRYADIGSSVMGRLVDLQVVEGQAVRRGAVLARIDPAQAASEVEAVAAQLRALQSEVAAAAAREQEARQALERAKKLRADGVLPQAELDSAIAAADSARAQAEAAARRVAQGRAQVDRARDSLAKTEITAPIDGVVTRLSVREGEMVVMGVQNQPGTILMTLSDLSSINAEVKVAEAEVLRLAPGQKAWVTLEAVPGRELPGHVVEIGASALPVTGTGAAAREFRVVVRLDQPDPALRPGLTCDVRILAQEAKNALTLPLQSVVLRPATEGGDRSGVFTLENGRARFVPVETGIIGGLDVEVKGLPEGTPVVVGPFQALRDLKDGTLVKAREEDKKGG